MKKRRRKLAIASLEQSIALFAQGMQDDRVYAAYATAIGVNRSTLNTWRTNGVPLRWAQRVAELVPAAKLQPWMLCVDLPAPTEAQAGAA